MRSSLCLFYNILYDTLHLAAQTHGCLWSAVHGDMFSVCQWGCGTNINTTVHNVHNVLIIAAGGYLRILMSSVLMIHRNIDKYGQLSHNLWWYLTENLSAQWVVSGLSAAMKCGAACLLLIQIQSRWSFTICELLPGREEEGGNVRPWANPWLYCYTTVTYRMCMYVMSQIPLVAMI